jgi:hypothetical protein
MENVIDIQLTTVEAWAILAELRDKSDQKDGPVRWFYNRLLIKVDHLDD